MTTETVKLSKTEILEKVKDTKSLQKIFSIYKNHDTEAYAYHIDFNSYSKANGLLGQIFIFKSGGKIIDILVPIFSTERTVTWNFEYNDIIKDTLANDYTLDVSEITKLAKAVIFNLDKWNGEVIFSAMIPVSDWIYNGHRSKNNNNSVYFWNDKLPNEWCLDSKKLDTRLLVNSLPNWTDKKIIQFCNEYATKKHKEFFDGESKRSAALKIKNISSGLYAQIKVYLEMLSKGHEVTMDWTEGDDLGIDIKLLVNNHTIKIDVKSTSDDQLKISRKRDETDFYAVVLYNKTTPQLLGFINKYSFWESDVLDTKAPEQNENTKMYHKKLTKKWIKEFLKVEDLFNDLQEYKRKKLRKKADLF